MYKKYLEILNVSKKKPSLSALKELIVSHIINVPFENISKLYYKVKYGLTEIPDFERYIGGIAKYKFGGTCYSVNYYFNRLLQYLGYEVILCGADMNSPDVHLVNIVTVENKEFLVDVGYAAPFFEPLPRWLAADYEVSFGRDKYILLPKDQKGNSKLELYRNGELKHGYTVRLSGKVIADFREVISDSFSETSTFMNSVLVVSYGKQYMKSIHNFSLLEYEKGIARERRIKDKAEMCLEIEKKFGIPKRISELAIEQLSNFESAWN